jgi:type I restriction enzyme S subunit
MNTYQEYTDSRLEWIGEIPKHWKMTVLKRLLGEPLKYGATEAGNQFEPDEPRYIRITDFDKEGFLRDDTSVSLPDNIAKDYCVAEGDILFARSGATAGKTFLFSNYKGRACFAGYLIKASPARNRIKPEFLYYYTKSPAYETWKDFIFTQATIQNIGADKYAYMPICVPPLFEQERIATFLDASCAVLNAVVAAKRRQIETIRELNKASILRAVTQGLGQGVKKADHQVPSYGPTPQHWKRSKLRYEISVQNGGFASDKLQDDGEYPVFGGNGIMGRADYFNVDGETVVIGRVGAYCGNAHHVTGRAWISDNALIVKSRNYARFLCHLFNALNFNTQANTTAQPLITGTKIKDTHVVLPPRKEQEAICLSIEKENARLAAIISNLEGQMTTLVAYRNSLINECVTGKRRVTEADAARVEKHAPNEWRAK